eukprot:1104272-Amphidinium_carterae.1
MSTTPSQCSVSSQCRDDMSRHARGFSTGNLASAGSRICQSHQKYSHSRQDLLDTRWQLAVCLFGAL